MKAYIPGGARSWLDALPLFWRNNPDVLLTLIPDDANWKEVEHEGCRIGCIELPSTRELIGLQVLAPPVGDWGEHRTRIKKAGYKMAKEVYAGPMANIPDSALLHAGMCPVITLRNDMSRKFFNLKAFAYYNQTLRGTN